LVDKEKRGKGEKGTKDSCLLYAAPFEKTRKKGEG